MLKNNFCNVLVIIFSPIVIVFFATPCDADNIKYCKGMLHSVYTNECPRGKRDVINAENSAIRNLEIKTEDESLFRHKKRQLPNPGATITSIRAPIVSEMVNSALKSRQPAVALAPIIGRLYLARSPQSRISGGLLSQGRGSVGSGSDLTMEEIEQFYLELFERSPRHLSRYLLDDVVKEQLARCCQNVELCIKNRDYPFPCTTTNTD